MSHSDMKIQWFIMFATTVCTCSACLITNCPKGGKRTAYEKDDTIKQCARCGPAKLGHCYGPAICCGPQIGCLIATPETARCLEEAASPVPCVAPSGAVCGVGDTLGRCTANGVCCTHESCSLDISCRITVGETLELMDSANPMLNLYKTISSSYNQRHALIESDQTL